MTVLVRLQGGPRHGELLAPPRFMLGRYVVLGAIPLVARANPLTVITDPAAHFLCVYRVELPVAADGRVTARFELATEAP